MHEIIKCIIFKDDTQVIFNTEGAILKQCNSKEHSIIFRKETDINGKLSD